MEYDLEAMRRAVARVRVMLFPRNFELALDSLARRKSRGRRKRGQISNKIGGGVTERVLLDYLEGVRTEKQLCSRIQRECSIGVCRSVLNIVHNLELSLYEELGSRDDHIRVAWRLQADSSAVGIVRLALDQWRAWHAAMVAREEALIRLRAEHRAKRRPPR